MAEAKPKVATVIITVDLKCCSSAAKIKCTLCQLEMSFKISSRVFDEKKGTMTVSGPFDPYCFICYLRRMAGDVIKNVEIQSDHTQPAKTPQPATLQRVWCYCYMFSFEMNPGGCGCGSSSGCGCGCSSGYSSCSGSCSGSRFGCGCGCSSGYTSCSGSGSCSGFSRLPWPPAP
ncbi:protein PYRICULARIA ORYZAE RESISTANCE 21-like [Zingiber officinale]|uniref:protein PYRICULARIA ORYZAE RESISTANCE 21-like n=1 Tax=Zingiber officinale TaxID=94328 RepID=UPI001C4BB8C9|nr:protein PYRICULARIA ORYZAE RESISTANCE 21-like [Zingiber officinale]